MPVINANDSISIGLTKTKGLHIITYRAQQTRDDRDELGGFNNRIEEKIWQIRRDQKVTQKLVSNAGILTFNDCSPLAWVYIYFVYFFYPLWGYSLSCQCCGL